MLPRRSDEIQSELSHTLSDICNEEDCGWGRRLEMLQDVTVAVTLTLGSNPGVEVVAEVLEK